jgi:hypothetical protein
MAVDFDALVLKPAMDAFAGDLATITPQGGAAFTRRVIFDRYSMRGLGDAETPAVLVNVTKVTLRLAEIPAGVTLRQRDLVEVRGAAWRVADLDRDGMGGLVLTLGNRGASEPVR